VPNKQFLEVPLPIWSKGTGSGTENTGWVSFHLPFTPTDCIFGPVKLLLEKRFDLQPSASWKAALF
jgi:hypothetical protein